MAERFSFARVTAVLMKEFVQMRRDRITLAMILGVPVMQLLLFGFAINLDPKHLPTAISADDSGRFTRALVASLENSDYFTVIKTTKSPEEARELLAEGKVNFVVEIPVDFSRNLTRGEQPQLLVDVDATDPASGTNAIGTFSLLTQTAFKDDLVGTLVRARAADACLSDRHPPPLQSRNQHAILDRARASGRHPHHDHGAAHQHGGDARARTRNLRKPSRHADDARRDHAGQDPAQHRRGPRPERDHPCSPPNGFSACRCWARSSFSTAR